MPSSRNGAAPPRAGSVRPSFTQIAASALAAVSAAVVSSTFGVAGTVIGAAIASVIASVGSTLYLASLRSTNERLRRLAAARRPDGTIAPGPAAEESLEQELQSEQRSRRSLRRIWLAAAVLTVAVFGIAVGVITAVEASTGKTVSALVGDGHRGGTTLGDLGTSKKAPKPSPSPTSTATPTPAPTPSVTPSSQPSNAQPSSAGPSAGAGEPSPSSGVGETPSPSPRATTAPAPAPSTGSAGETPATAP
jgi:hypothetical protein